MNVENGLPGRKLGFTDYDHGLTTIYERLGTRFTTRHVEEVVGIRLHRQHRTTSFLLFHMCHQLFMLYGKGKRALEQENSVEYVC